MSITTDDSVIRQDLIRTAAKAIQNACAALGYPCSFNGEMASFGYGLSSPPTKLEVMILPKIPNEKLLPIDALKRMIACLPTGVEGIFTVSPLILHPTVLAFQHNWYRGQWGTIIIDITIGSDIDALTIHPFQIINDICYPCPEYVLARSLDSWIQAQNIQPLSLSITTQAAHRNRVIDPLLRHLANMHVKLTNWRALEIRHIVKYCGVYPDSTELWTGVGFSPLLVNPPKSNPPTSDSLTMLRPLVEIPVPNLQNQNIAPPTPSSSSSTSTLVEFTPASLTSNDLKAAPTLQAHPESLNNTSRINMLFLAAQRTVELLQSMSLPSAISGSLACFMYGNRRTPDDVNILVLPSPECDLKVEGVKMSLAVNDAEHFFLVPSEDAKPGTKFLFYRLEKAGSGEALSTSCKVDLVFPGTHDLPNLPTSKINWDEGLPLIPFSLLLLQKLQKWEYHGDSADKLKVLKQRKDVEDLRRLFELDLVEELKHSSSWADNKVISRTFFHDSLNRARKFSDAHPDTLQCWKDVGLLPRRRRRRSRRRII